MLKKNKNCREIFNELSTKTQIKKSIFKILILKNKTIIFPKKTSNENVCKPFLLKIKTK